MSGPVFDFNKFIGKFLGEQVDPFRRVEWHVDDDGGYVVWRRGTGGNCELLHLKAARPGLGSGGRLLRVMLQALAADPPYATVFGFTLPDNTAAHAFYEAMGFELNTVKGVYQAGSAVLFSQTYEGLCQLHLTEES